MTADHTFGGDKVDKEGKQKVYHMISTPSAFEELPTWKWEEVYNFVGKVAPPKGGSGSKAMVAALADAAERKKEAEKVAEEKAKAA